MARKYLCVYYDMIPALEALSYAEVGRLLIAALKYSRDGETVDLTGNERFTWPLLMAQIDRSNAQYEERCIINRRNASSRSDSLQVAPNRTESPTIQEEDKKNTIQEEDKKSESKAKARAFTPPTLDEIRTYCTERGNRVDPERFLDYYTANGWRVGKNPMKDWKAAVRSWERTGYDTPAKKPRQYTTAAEYEQNRKQTKVPPKEIWSVIDKI